MKIKRKILVCMLFFLCIIALILQLTGAFSIHTDYAVKHLRAETGVSLTLTKGEGIQSVAQTGYVIKIGDIGRYRAGTTSFIYAEVQEGYQFSGWYQGDEMLSNQIQTEHVISTSCELDARATLASYDLTFFPNGGVFQGDIPFSYTIQSDEILLPTPVREGYTFDGWYTDIECSGESVKSIPKGSTGERTYYAKWTEKKAAEVYALLLQNSADSTNQYPMIFVKSEERIYSGSVYPSKTYGELNVSNVYRNFFEVDYDEGTDTAEKKSGDVPWRAVRSKITSITFEDIISPKSTAFWFYGFENCDVMDMQNLDTSNLENAAYMFYDAASRCAQVQVNGLESWDLSSVKKMTGMFESYGTVVDNFSIPGIGSWDVSHVNQMDRMFALSGRNADYWDMESLEQWDTSSAVTMENMFLEAGTNAKTFTLPGLDAWDVSSVKNMYGMFDQAGYKASAIELGDLGAWNVSNVEDMGYMFSELGYQSTSWHIGDLSSWDVSAVQRMQYMFNRAGRGAGEFNLGNLGEWNVSNVEDMQRTFFYAGYSAKNYYIGELDEWDVGKVTCMEGMFCCSGYSSTEWSIGSLDQWEVGNVTNMSLMFNRSGRRVSYWSIGNLENWDVSGVTNMQSMFDSAGFTATTFALEGLEGWNTGNVTDMSYMFYSVSYATDWFLDCSGWNVEKVTNYDYFNKLAESKVIAPIWS